MAIAVHSSPLVVVPLTEQDLPAALTIQEESFPIPWNERQFRDEMALRWSLGKEKAADTLFAAVGKALDRGARTRDLGGELATSQMADAVIAAL